LLVFLLAAVVIAVVAGLAAWLGDPSSVRDNLSSNGVPVDRNTWSDIGVGAAIAAIVAMLLGSLVGGIQGDRWHGRLVTAAAERHEAANPEVRHDAPHPLGDDPLTTGPVVDVVRAERERSVEDERYQAEIAAADLGF
jgi:hypothetical protein